METLSVIILLLLALFGYSTGAIIGASGKRISPQPLNLVSILLLWAGAILTRESLGKWLAILVWLGAGVIVGLLITRFQKDKAYLTDTHKPSFDADSGWRRAWLRWTYFSSKIGDYQSRAILAFLYFTVVLPFGLVFRLFGDPLNVRKAPTESMWHKWEATAKSIEEARRQF